MLNKIGLVNLLELFSVPISINFRAFIKSLGSGLLTKGPNSFWLEKTSFRALNPSSLIFILTDIFLAAKWFFTSLFWTNSDWFHGFSFFLFRRRNKSSLTNDTIWIIWILQIDLNFRQILIDFTSFLSFFFVVVIKVRLQSTQFRRNATSHFFKVSWHMFLECSDFNQFLWLWQLFFLTSLWQPQKHLWASKDHWGHGHGLHNDYVSKISLKIDHFPWI